MQKSIYTVLWASFLLSCVSCMKIDNFDEPDATIGGKIIDSTTGENFITEQGGFNIRIWEKSWNDHPNPQDLAVKQDGTYTNTKMFAGVYDMLPYNGAFWPADTIKGVHVGKSVSQDFEVIPYLKITDFQWKLDGTNLTVSCKLKAPVTQGLPQVIEVRPFLSLTQFCGNGNRISAYYKDEYRVALNKEWAAIGDMNTGEGNEVYTVTGLTLKSGRTYYVRMGAKVRDTFENYNYSEIVEITVP